MKTESEMLTLGLALLLLCGESARMLNLSPLLAGMAAGFVIVNRDRRDVRVFRTINAFEPPIYVLFFTVIETQARLETILTASAEHDLIVIATRSGGGLSRLIWGPLAEAVARRSERPTVIVHQRAPVVSVEEKE